METTRMDNTEKGTVPSHAQVLFALKEQIQIKNFDLKFMRKQLRIL